MQTKYENGKPIRTDKFQGVGELTSSEARFHQQGKTVRWGKTVKKIDNGDFVQWCDDERDGYHGYMRYDRNGKPLYDCDKDGNCVE